MKFIKLSIVEKFMNLFCLIWVTWLQPVISKVLMDELMRSMDTYVILFGNRLQTWIFQKICRVYKFYVR